MKADGTALEPGLLSRAVAYFVTDSRKVQPGDLFFAFSQPEFENNCFNGEFMDATSFAASALNSGAIAAVIRRDRFDEQAETLRPFHNRLIFSDDVIVAFQSLAHGVWLDWGNPVVGVTGSAGKTTAKELIAHLLEESGRRVLRTEKSMNNGLGLPMTVLKLQADSSYDVAVLEMGMSTPNREIARLCEITPPEVGVVLNVLPVHVEYLGSLENVAKAKAEMIEGIKPGGIAVLNADDENVVAMCKLHEGKTLTFGIEKKADLMALGVTMKSFGETHFTLRTPDGDEEVVFQLSGKHNVLNALAASAVGFGFGMTAQEISQALGNVKPPTQRGEILHFQDGFTVINDSYNSNPMALRKMISTMIEGADANQRKILVAGEMLELGTHERQIHNQLGKEIAKSGIDFLLGVRGLAMELVEGAKSEGFENAQFASDSDEAADMLLAFVEPNDLILVKGSRGVRTEKVIEKLKEKFEVTK